MPGAEPSGGHGPRRPEALSGDEREVLHRAHQRLRNASQALEALVATDPIRGRWAPAPAPAEALLGARADLQKAYDALERRHEELVDWGEPGPERPPERETGPERPSERETGPEGEPLGGSGASHL